VILVDANLLIYAYDESSPRRDRAAAWLESSFRTEWIVGLSWTAIGAFLRILTSRAYPGAVDGDTALGVVADWLERPNVTILEPTANHWRTMTGLVRDGQAFGALITDAHIAALAIDHGATLCTNDRDFARFPKLKLLDPLS
jgi:hypothetical protein